jgi:ferredoxin
MFNSYRTTTLEYHEAECSNCGFCLAVCPHGVFESGSKAVRLVYPDRCMECGACQVNCPSSAIQVESGVGCASAMISAALRGKKLDRKEDCT